MYTTTCGQHFPTRSTTTHFMNIVQLSEKIINQTGWNITANKCTAGCVHVCSRESSFNDIQMPGVCTAAAGCLWHYHWYWSRSNHFSILLLQLQVCLKDAPLSHSTGATTQMRIEWYEKTCTCMLTGWHIKLQVCEYFKKLRVGGRPKTVQHPGGHYSQYANHLIRHIEGISQCSWNAASSSIWH